MLSLTITALVVGFNTIHLRLKETVKIPTREQIDWLDLELGGMFNYGIGMPDAPWVPQGDDCCCGKQAPPAMGFNSTANMSNWMEGLTSMGARYSVFTASGGCGYFLWDTKLKFPDGTPFNYTLSKSPNINSRDILADYVRMSNENNIATGIYYQFAYNYWMGWQHGVMAPHGNNTPQLTPQQYFNLVEQAMDELWGSYGSWAEIWFDGGLQGWDNTSQAKIAQMMANKQPQAVAFQGPTTTQAVRWIGNELGHAPEANYINAANSMDNGPGMFSGGIPAPAEADTPFASGIHTWWWAPGQTIKSVPELSTEYDNSVGHGANMLLGLTPDYSGNLPDYHMKRYVEFGTWIKDCYGTPAAEQKNIKMNNSILLPVPGSSIDRIWIMEDLTKGQVVTSFSIELKVNGIWGVGVPWIFPCLTLGQCSPKIWKPTSKVEPFFYGNSIGHKRIVKIGFNDTVPVVISNVTAIRVNLTYTSPGTIRSLAVFNADGCKAQRHGDPYLQ